MSCFEEKDIDVLLEPGCDFIEVGNIAGEDDGHVLAEDAEGVTDRLSCGGIWRLVVVGEGLDGDVIVAEDFACGKFVEFEGELFWAGMRKIAAFADEELACGVEDLRSRCVDGEGLVGGVVHEPLLLFDRLQKEGNARDVVEVRVREEERTDVGGVKTFEIGGSGGGTTAVKPVFGAIVAFEDPRGIITSGNGLRAGTTAEDVK